MHQLGDQVVSAQLYKDALLLSHLARSILVSSCAAVEKKLGRRLEDRSPESCVVEPRFMAVNGDQDTMDQLARLYRKIAVEIGATGESQLQVESMFPATAAGRAFDLVGMIFGQSPNAEIRSFKFENPTMVDHLTREGAGTCKKPSMLPAVLGGLGIIAGGIAVGWALSRD